MPPAREGQFCDAWCSIEKRCKAQDLAIGYKSELCKMGELILTLCTSYDVLLHKELLLGVAMIAPALKFLVALIF